MGVLQSVVTIIIVVVYFFSLGRILTPRAPVDVSPSRTVVRMDVPAVKAQVVPSPQVSPHSPAHFLPGWRTTAPLETLVNGLDYIDVKSGKGDVARQGDVLDVQYTGYFPNGRKFDSSYKHGGQPFPFLLGAGMVIKGWDQGFAGMRVGGKRKLILSPEFGYGDSGSPPTIPPNAILVFDVELLGSK